VAAAAAIRCHQPQRGMRLVAQERLERGVRRDQRKSEADLSAEMARLLLGGASIEDSLPTVGQRLARTFGLQSASVELRWVDSDQRRKALPLIVEGDRVGTLLVPRDADPAVLDALRDRVVCD